MCAGPRWPACLQGPAGEDVLQEAGRRSRSHKQLLRGPAGYAELQQQPAACAALMLLPTPAPALCPTQEEWINLCREDRNRRLQLLPGPDRAFWPPAPPPPPAASQPAASEAAAAPPAGPASGTAGQVPQGMQTIGRCVGIWSRADNRFYYATVGSGCGLWRGTGDGGCGMATGGAAMA